ncbi:MAG: LamG domain-containing protein [Planctomycetota bacterium]
MCKKLICSGLLLLVLSLTHTASANLVAHWRLDEGSGTTAADASGNGNTGNLQGDPKWSVGKIGGALQLDGTGDYVDCGNSDVFNITEQVTLAAWVQANAGFAYPDWSGIIMRGGPNIDTFALYYNGPNLQVGFKTTGTTPSWMAVAATGLFDNEWHHVAAVYDGARKFVYLDGEQIGTVDSSGSLETGNGRLLLGAGRDLSPPTHHLVGKIDDARIYDEALAQEEIQTTMQGGEGYPYALAPNPADGAIHTETWVNLSWSPGDFAVSHDVYLGDNFGDVNDGTGDTFRGNQTLTFIVAGFPGFPYPDGLVPGTTYYWRIDEVNEAEPNSPWKGPVWSFSIPPQTAYAPNPADGAEFVDPSATFSWTGGYGAKLHTVYIGTDFDDVNNDAGGAPQGTVTYKPGPLGLEKVYYWRVDEFDAVSTYKGEIWSFTTPGAAGSLQPANGAKDVQINSTLNWTPATTATSHDVYFGIDKDAVKNATTASPEYKGNKALGSESYDPGKLAWHSDYYWRVDAVYNTGTVKGLVWSFTTADFLLVDDFESYNDIDPPDAASNRIFDKWIDGFGTTNNGALVGNDLPPYAEQTVVHGGTQSLVYRYDNNLKTSEATLTLVYPRDWTEEGVTKLSLWLRGASANSAERMYVALNGTAVVYHDDPAATQASGWTQWVIDLQAFADQGVNLTNVNTITIGIGTKNSPAAGGTGTMYFDDIRLYRPAVAPEPQP